MKKIFSIVLICVLVIGTFTFTSANGTEERTSESLYNEYQTILAKYAIGDVIDLKDFEALKELSRERGSLHNGEDEVSIMSTTTWTVSGTKSDSYSTVQISGQVRYEMGWFNHTKTAINLKSQRVSGLVSQTRARTSTDVYGVAGSDGLIGLIAQPQLSQEWVSGSSATLNSSVHFTGLWVYYSGRAYGDLKHAYGELTAISSEHTKDN